MEFAEWRRLLTPSDCDLPLEGAIKNRLIGIIITNKVNVNFKSNCTDTVLSTINVNKL